MKKILITGGSGFIGKTLINQLLLNNFKVHCYDLKNFKSNSKNFKFFKGNILDKEKINLAIKGCEIVIHLAASLGVLNTEKNNLECLDSNIFGTKNILEIAAKNKIKKFIFASSSEIYGEQKIFPISEKAEPKFKSIYGLSKITAESYVKAYYQKYKMKYNIIRYFNVYGEDQRQDFVISKFTQNIKNNKNLTVYGDGGQIRSFCHVNDAVAGTLEIIRRANFNTTYNVGNNLEPISMIKLAKKMIKISKKNIGIDKINFKDSDRTQEREIFKRIPDISKITRDTKYKPKNTLESGIKSFYKKYGVK